MTIKPNTDLKLYRPDEIAECWEGVNDDLYRALWDAMADLPPLSDVIDVEDSSPHDAIGIHSVASLWDRFTEEQQRELNQMAEDRADEPEYDPEDDRDDWRDDGLTSREREINDRLDMGRNDAGEWLGFM